MKYWPFAIPVLAALAGIIVFTSGAQPAPSNPFTAGRYQIFTGHIRVDNRDYPAILRLDTATGKTWKLSQLDTNATLAWFAIPE